MDVIWMISALLLLLCIENASGFGREYSLDIRTGTTNNCDSDSLIELTLINVDDDEISTAFTPSNTKGGSVTTVFTERDIGTVTQVKFDMISGSNGWCFDYFELSLDSNNFWTSCTTVGYNSYDIIAIDSDLNMGLGAVKDITLDVTQGSSTLDCEFSRNYFVTVETASENNCDSDSLIELTLINNDGEEISTIFTPSKPKGGLVTTVFTERDIGTVTQVKFDMISGTNGWCFDYFDLSLDSSNSWTSCTTVGYNAYDVIAIDADLNMGLSATTEITLDVKQGSSTLDCDFSDYDSDIRNYYMTIETGSENYCDSDSTIELTFIHDDGNSATYDSISTTFIPSGTTGDSTTISFNGRDIGDITDIEFDMVSGSNGWCFDSFIFLSDTNNVWTRCTTVGYNSYDLIAIDSDTSLGYDSTTDITLDVTPDSSILECDFSYDHDLRNYYMTIKTGSENNCDSDSTIALTYIHKYSATYDSISTTFIPSGTTGDSTTTTFTGRDIGDITHIKFDMISGANGWCFDYFRLLLGTNYVWTRCTTVGNNSYDVIAIDSNTDMGLGAITDITLDVTPDSSSLDCDFSPRKTIEFEGGNLTLSSKSKFFEIDNVAGCMIEYDSTGTKILNTSYIELYHDQADEYGNITIGTILLSNITMFDLLPSNCSHLQAAKVNDIVIESDLIRLYVTIPSVFEYIEEIDVNCSNMTHYLPTFHDMIVNDSDSDNNDTVVTQEVLVCDLNYPNGTLYQEIENITICEEALNVSLAEILGSVDESDYQEDRRRLRDRLAHLQFNNDYNDDNNNVIDRFPEIQHSTRRLKAVDVDIDIEYISIEFCIARVWGWCVGFSWKYIPIGIGITISAGESISREIKFSKYKTFSGSMSYTPSSGDQENGNDGDDGDDESGSHSVSGDYTVRAGGTVRVGISGSISFRYTKSFGFGMINYIKSLASGDTGALFDFLSSYIGEIDFKFSSSIGIDASGSATFGFDGAYSYSRTVFDENVEYWVYPGGVPVLITYGNQIDASISVPFTSNVGAWFNTGNVGFDLSVEFNTQHSDFEVDFKPRWGNPSGGISGGIGNPVLDVQNGCLSGTVIPSLSLKTYVRFYAAIEVYIQHALEVTKTIEYPVSCGEYDQCAGYNFRHWGISTKYEMPVSVGYGIVADSAFTFHDDPSEIARHTLGSPTSVCSLVPQVFSDALSNVYGGCCPPTSPPTSYPTPEYINTEGCDEIDGGGWQLVRHVKAGGGWHPINDNLEGDGYDEEYISNDAQSGISWSKDFHDRNFNQFLFAFGDCSTWLITSKTTAIGSGYYSNEDKCIIDSSETSITSPYFAKWYYRSTNGEDPWISTVDHFSSSGKMVYGENGSGGHINGKNSHGGANVWIRNKNDTRGCIDGLEDGDYVRIGEYSDSSDGNLRYGPQTSGYLPDTCADACNEDNYPYFSLQSGGECFCDDDLDHATKDGSGDCSDYYLGSANCNVIYQITSRIGPTTKLSDNYVSIELLRNWEGANEYCETIFGTHLASITSIEDNRYAKLYISSNEAFIGYNDITSEGNFEWIDGTSDDYFTSWYPGQPNNANSDQDCVLLKDFGSSYGIKWHDHSCSGERKFVCNYPRYIGVNSEMSYSSANDYCLSNYGTTLASVRNYDMNMMARDASTAVGVSTSGKSLWLGLNDIVVEGLDDFEWNDGSTSEYRYWQPGEPNNSGGNQDCTQLYDQGTWDDDSCSNSKPFVCNFPKYIGVNDAKTWEDANEHCQSEYGTHLATIVSSSDNDNVRRAANYAGISSSDVLWIGLNDRETENTWEWADPSVTITPTLYTNWSPGQPDSSGNQDCVRMYSSGHWDDASCTNSGHATPFVCNAPQYIAVKERLNYDAAELYCQNNFGTSLARINNEEMNNLVLWTARSVGISIDDSLYIGLTRSDEWRWSNGDVAATVYTNWAPNRPNNAGSGDQDCVKMYAKQHWSGQYEGEWDDIECSLTNYFVCNL